jgi:hypothetical protein
VTGPEELLTLARKVAEQDIDLYSDPEQRQAVADATELAQGVLELEAERDKIQAKHDAFAFRASTTLVAERERADKAVALLGDLFDELTPRGAEPLDLLRPYLARFAELRADAEAARGHTASDAD